MGRSIGCAVAIALLGAAARAELTMEEPDDPSPYSVLEPSKFARVLGSDYQWAVEVGTHTTPSPPALAPITLATTLNDRPTCHFPSLPPPPCRLVPSAPLRGRYHKLAARGY